MPSLSWGTSLVTGARAEPALALYRYDWHLGHLIPISPPTAPASRPKREPDGSGDAGPTAVIEGVSELVVELLAA
jgi:hypothetical protein